MTKIVNIRNYNRRDYIYMGRGSPYGNPYVIGRDGNRAQVIAKFRADFLSKVSNEPDFAQKVLNLYGKTLGCYCKPLACHVDVIVEWIEKVRAEESGQ
jgi:hypothetical protein